MNRIQMKLENWKLINIIQITLTYFLSKMGCFSRRRLCKCILIKPNVWHHLLWRGLGCKKAHTLSGLDVIWTKTCLQAFSAVKPFAYGCVFMNIRYDVTSYSTHLQIIHKTLVPQMLSGYWATIHAHPGIAAELNLKRRNSKTNVVLRAGICNESKTWQNEKNILEVEKTVTLFGSSWRQFGTFESIWHPPSINLMPFTLLASKCHPYSPLGNLL